MNDAERTRLTEAFHRERNWQRWGPYLSERQWGTVREDYSEWGNCWEYLPHDHARSRAYRWGEDGLLGICDREGRLCFALALWNERDPILKERLFGVTCNEGNHGEDVKEYYFYLDSTPTHSYMKALYKYPQREYPYAELVAESRRRGRRDPEYELLDTGVFDGDRYFDVFVEYAKASPDDIAIRITAANRGPEAAPLHLLPTLWFRNTWSWGRTGEGYWPKPKISALNETTLLAEHASLRTFRLEVQPGAELLFTENETNMRRLFQIEGPSPYVKDAFHEYVVHRRRDLVNPLRTGTKAAAYYTFEVPPGASAVLNLRLKTEGEDLPDPFAARIAEADAFYAGLLPKDAPPECCRVQRQAYAGLLWTKQFFYYAVQDWLEGDPSQPRPPDRRWTGRNRAWKHLYNRDVISMPDKWEYPWYAAWDLAFHMIPFARLDPNFAKEQLVLMLREWYTHPNGQIPAYEFAFSDVNPPVHAWSAWRVYKITAPRKERDHLFLERVFQKLLINFTWWVNRKDADDNNVFSGGFLGLDNIGVFDRSQPLPDGRSLEQADGTAWMAFYCTTMLAMSLELARTNPAYEDVASKFFEHFVAIADAMNTLGGQGLWDETDGFYYDQLRADGTQIPLKIRSMVGLIPLVAVTVLDQINISHLPGFQKRMRWFLENRRDLAKQISYMQPQNGPDGRLLLAIPSRARLESVLRYMLDENEFLSAYGIRSVSRYHLDHPYVLARDGEERTVQYQPAESNSGLFGGNSNWRGPIWFPVNYLLAEALERYHHFYGDRLQVECPTGSGVKMNLAQVARELNRRMASIFLPDAAGRSPWQGGIQRFAHDPHWKDLVMFYEYFHGDNGTGLGASHQTGWTALVIRSLEDLLRQR
jgi:hypothetical protein